MALGKPVFPNSLISRIPLNIRSTVFQSLGALLKMFTKGSGSPPPLISSFSVNCFKQEGKDFECLTGKPCSQVQSDVLKTTLYFISRQRLLSATQLFSCKHIAAIGKPEAIDYQLKHSGRVFN